MWCLKESNHRPPQGAFRHPPLEALGPLFGTLVQSNALENGQSTHFSTHHVWHQKQSHNSSLKFLQSILNTLYIFFFEKDSTKYSYCVIEKLELATEEILGTISPAVACWTERQTVMNIRLCFCVFYRIQCEYICRFFCCCVEMILFSKRKNYFSYILYQGIIC